MTYKTVRRMRSLIMEERNKKLMRELTREIKRVALYTRTSKLDRFKPTILKMVRQDPGLNTRVLHELLKKRGFKGSITILRRYVADQKLAPFKLAIAGFLLHNYDQSESSVHPSLEKLGYKGQIGTLKSYIEKLQMKAKQSKRRTAIG